MTITSISYTVKIFCVRFDRQPNLMIAQQVTQSATCMLHILLCHHQIY